MSIERWVTVSTTLERAPSSASASSSIRTKNRFRFSRSTSVDRPMKLCTLEILKFEMRPPSAQNTPAFFGTRIVLIPRSLACMPMCTGPAPPNAMSAKSRGSRPRAMET